MGSCEHDGAAALVQRDGLRQRLISSPSLRAMAPSISRRHFLASTSALGLAPTLSPFAQAASVAPSEQVVTGYIGCGIRYHNFIGVGCGFGPAAALADVDYVQLGRAVQSAREQHLDRGYPISINHYADYRRVLDRDDIDAVVVATPDHWHTKITVEALHAGKHVYCEKPLTLTIAEGRQILDAIKATGRVVQVGTQQRTEFDKRFATAAAMARGGRVGALDRVTVAIGGSLTCPSLPVAPVPKELDWDRWLGPAPLTDYRASPTIVEQQGYGAGHPFSRTHNYFRWWYEYSGGKLTDWGAHHVDIAMWAINKSDGSMGPYTVEPLSVSHPVAFRDGYPIQADRFNAATRFHVRVTFQDGLVLDVRDRADDLGFDNGIMFEGERGRYFVNRGKLTGKPVEDLKTNSLPEDALRKLYGKKPPQGHMADFVECMKSGGRPASDVASHHAHLSVCHAVNIAMRLGRKLTFDPRSERFVGDDQANTFVAREPRKGYEIDA